MKAFYNKLVEIFKAEDTKDLYRTKGILNPKFIDLYAGQDFEPESFEIYPTPAIFVNWSIDHRQTPSLASLSFRLCYQQLRDTSNLGKNTQEALKFLDFIEITDQILTSFESECTGKLNPATQELNIEPVVIDEYILTYTCSYTKNKDPQEVPTGEINEIQVKSGLFTKLLDV